MWSVCLCAPACPVCVPCVSRLPPVSFYRYTGTVPLLYRYRTSIQILVRAPRVCSRGGPGARKLGSLVV